MYEYFQSIKSLPFCVKLFLLTEIPFGLAIGIWNVTLNFHLKLLGLNEVGIGYITAFGMITIAIASIFAGTLNNRFGYRIVMASGCGILGLGFLLISINIGIAGIVAGQFLYSVGLAFLLSTEFPYLTGMTEDAHKQMVYSLLISMYFFSMIFGNIFSGEFSSYIHLRDPYALELAIGGLLLLAMAVLRGFLPSIKVAVKRKQKFFTVVLKPKVLSYLLFGAVTMILFNSVMSMMNFILRNRFQFSDGAVGIIFAVTSIAGGIAAFISPLIARKYRSDRKSIVVIAIQAVAVTAMAIPLAAPFVMLLTIRSMMCNMVYSMVDSSMLQSIDREEQATYSGSRLFSNYIGMSIGSCVAGYLISYRYFAGLMLLSGCFAGIQLIVYTFACRKHILQSLKQS